ncbi:MAG: HNH endonuclease [Dehalococcoidia bacterium]
MSDPYISVALRRRVIAQARGRYGYCLGDETIVGIALEIEHIIPRAAGGGTEEENLWLSCMDCNSRKGTQTSAQDPLTGATVALYDPRHQRWTDHLAWADGVALIEGLTPAGRAAERVDRGYRLERPLIPLSTFCGSKLGRSVLNA